MDRGWIKLYRSIADNQFWISEPFSRGQAWVDLLLLANHKDGFFYNRDHKINVNRGQVGMSVLKLAERWGWSRSKVNKFLNDLEKEQQVKVYKSQSQSLIEIINYGEYQKKEQQDEQQKDNRKTTERQQKDTNKNDKNDKNEKEEIPEGFSSVVDLWLQYKKERKETYKPTGKNAFVKKLVKLSNGEPKKALAIIEQSMANNWAGIFELKQDENKSQITPMYR